MSDAHVTDSPSAAQDDASSLGARPTRTGAAGARRATPAALWVAALAVLLAGIATWWIPAFVDWMAIDLLQWPRLTLPPTLAGLALGAYALMTFGTLLPCFLFLGWLLLPSARQSARGRLPSVSLIVPAFNEESGIRRCLRAASKLDYPVFETLVIDDGSSDRTSAQIEMSEVTCIRVRKQGGKANAVNLAAARAKGEVLVFSDSDSWLDPAALRYIVGPFSDPRVGAVAGSVVIGAPTSFLRRWQQLEYLQGQAVVKCAQVGSGGSVLVCPGVLFAVRADVLRESGGFSDRTLTEDFDLTLEIIARGYHVEYEPRAVSYTDSPATWRELQGQRLRWGRGSLQTLKHHRSLVFKRELGPSGRFWLPYIIAYGYGAPLLTLAALALAPFMAWSTGMFGDALAWGALFWGVLELSQLIQYAVAVRTLRQPAWLLLSAPLLAPYRIFLDVVRVRALMHELQALPARWNP